MKGYVMKKILLLSVGFVLVFAMSFAPNKDCKECHPQIFKEYQTSQHANATIFKDPIHAAVWKKNPLSKKQAYKCAKCHTPAANNINKLIAPNGIGPDPKNPTQNDAVACAYCHRIKAIKEGLTINHNIVSPQKKRYFGARTNHITSPYHQIDTSNLLFLQGNVCMGCHSHKRNKFGLNVCSTNEHNEIENANCVSCHMPKMAGSVSTLKKRKNHAFHGFAGAHSHQKFLKKYVDIEFLAHLQGFDIAINSKIPHDFLLHPARVAFMVVKVQRQNKTVFNKKEILVRILGKNGKPTPPWLANRVVKDSMLKANEKRVFHYGLKLKKGDTIIVALAYKLVKPPFAKKLGVKNNKTYIFKKAVFRYQ